MSRSFTLISGEQQIDLIWRVRFHSFSSSSSTPFLVLVQQPFVLSSIANLLLFVSIFSHLFPSIHSSSFFFCFVKTRSYKKQPAKATVLRAVLSSCDHFWSLFEWRLVRVPANSLASAPSSTLFNFLYLHFRPLNRPACLLFSTQSHLNVWFPLTFFVFRLFFYCFYLTVFGQLTPAVNRSISPSKVWNRSSLYGIRTSDLHSPTPFHALLLISNQAFATSISTNYFYRITSLEVICSWSQPTIQRKECIAEFELIIKMAPQSSSSNEIL